MLRPRHLWRFYRQRLRSQRKQEAFAAAGISVSVGLVFAVLVANTSISTSAHEILHGIAGHATLQMKARDEHGFPASVLRIVRSLPTVEHSAGLFEQRAILTGTKGRTSVVLVGVGTDLVTLGGPMTTRFRRANGLILIPGLVLPSGVANAVGLPPRPPDIDPPVTAQIRGRAFSVPVTATPGHEDIGKLAGALVAVGKLSYVQRLSALSNRLTRIFVQPRPGQQGLAMRELQAIANDRITVAPVSRESDTLARASAPNDQSTVLFAAIGAIIGLIIAFGAMLLTAPDRRLTIAEFRKLGFSRSQVVLMVMFEAFLLGTLASGIGLALGDLAVHRVFKGVPEYLAFAFPMGVEQTFPRTTEIGCFLGGLLATSLAAGLPLLDLRKKRSPDQIYREDGAPGYALSDTTQHALSAVALALGAGAVLLVGLHSAATEWGIALLAIAVVCALPDLISYVTNAAERFAAPRGKMALLRVATQALRATRLRCAALAAIAAVTLFGAVSMHGAQGDLARGLHQSFVSQVKSTDLWITTGGKDLITENFRAGDAIARVRNVSGVAAVHPYFGSLLDIGDRRAWLIAHLSSDHSMLPTSQVVAGDPTRAAALLRRGGAVAASMQIADAQHAHVGGVLALPTPTGTHRYRLVATVTNLGWGPGAVILNAGDYQRDWAAHDPTAFEVDLHRGVNPVRARAAVQRALGPGFALHVETADELVALWDRLAHAGLHRLTQIWILLLVAAVLALVAAIATANAQRREDVRELRRLSLPQWDVVKTMMIESALVLTTGCAIGALAGLYGHYLLGRWLRDTTGFPAPFSLALFGAGATLVAVVAAALGAILYPSYRAAKVPPTTGHQT